MEPKYLVAPDNILDPDGGVMFVKGQEVAVSDPDTEALRRKQGFVDAGTIEPTWKDHVSHIAEKVARGEAGELFEDPTGESSTPAYVAKSAVQGAADSVVHGLTGLEKGIVGGTLDLASAGARVLGGDKLADQLQDAKRFNEQMMDTKTIDDMFLGGAFDNSREAWEKVMGVSESLGGIAGGVAAAKLPAAGLKAAKIAKTAEGAMKGAFTAQMAAGGEEGARQQVLTKKDEHGRVLVDENGRPIVENRDLTWREKAEVGYHTLKEGITAQFFGRLVGAWGKKIGNAGAAALEFGGINAAGVLADAYIGDNIAGRPWREIDEKSNSRLMTGNEKDWAVLQKAGAEFLYGGMQSLLMSMGGGIAGKKPAEVAANREKVVREPPPVVAEGANGEKVLEGGALVRTAEDGAVELVTPDGVVLDADGKVKTVAAGNVGQTGDNSYGIAITTRTNPLTGKPTAARETVRNALVALQEGVTADMLREIDGWTPENKAVFETVARLKQGLTDGMPAGELVDALASLGIGEAEARAFGFIPDGNRYVADALAVANNGTRQLANAVSNGGPGHIPLEIAAEVVRSVNAGTTGLMPEELGKRQMETARQIVAERAKAALEESAAGHGNVPEAERKVLDTPVENEDGTLTTVGAMVPGAELTHEAPSTKHEAPGTTNTLRARHEREQSVRALGLKPLGDGTYGVGRFPQMRVEKADGVADDSGRPVSAIRVTGLDPAEMLRPENILDMARVLGDLHEKCAERGVRVDFDPEAMDAVNEVMAKWETDVRQDPVLRVRSEVVTSLLEKSGLASGIVTDQAAFEAALRAAGGEKAEKLIVDGQTYGFCDPSTDTVYLNPAFFGTKVGLNTPIHEFGHLGIIACRKINRPLYDRGLKLIQDTPYWKEVTEHPDYKNDTPQKNAEEALTRLIADRGEKLAAETPKGVLAEIKQWLVEFWKTFGDALGLRDITPEQVEKMTVEQIADAIRAEMLRGEKFGTSRAQVEAQQQSGRRLKADARKRSPQAYIEAGGEKASKAFAFWATNGKRIMNVPKPGEFGWDIYQQLVLGVKEPTERARIKRLLCGENVKNTRRKGNDEILAEFNRTMGGEGDIYTDESGYQQMLEEFLASHADYERWRAEGAKNASELEEEARRSGEPPRSPQEAGSQPDSAALEAARLDFDPAELEEWSRIYDESRQAMAEAGLADEPDARVPDDAMWARGGIRFARAIIGGRETAVAEGNPLSKKDAKDPEKVLGILAPLVGKSAAQIGEMKLTRISEKSIEHLVMSEHAQVARKQGGNEAKRLWRGTVGGMSVIDDIVATSGLGSASGASHLNKDWKKSAKFYTAKTRFAIEGENGYEMYPCKLVVVELKNGERYVYDLTDIGLPTHTAKVSSTTATPLGNTASEVTATAVSAGQAFNFGVAERQLLRRAKGTVHSVADYGSPVKGVGAQTDSRQFKMWFADSMAVDPEGKPLVVYRRDNEEFTVFDQAKTQQNDAGWLGKGFYFYGDKGEAERATGYGKNLRAFYIKAENPYYITPEEYNRLVEADDVKVSADFTQKLRDEGYDSVYWDGDGRQEWMVLEPEQVKSATDNIGTFDPGNPDIRFSRGGYKPGDWRKTFTFGKAARGDAEQTPGGIAAGEERRRWEENPVDERIPEWDAPARNPNIAKPFALSSAEGVRLVKLLGGVMKKPKAYKDAIGVIDESDEQRIRDDLKAMGFFKGDDFLWAATATPAEVEADRADSQAALDARLEKLGEQRLKGEAGGGNRGLVRVSMSQVADLVLSLPAETGGNLGNVRTLAQGIVRGFERDRTPEQAAYYLQEAQNLIGWFYGHEGDAGPRPGGSPEGAPPQGARDVRKMIARAFGAFLEAPDAVAEHAPGLYREFVDAVARNAKLSAAFDAIRRTALGEGSASRVYAEIEQSRTVAAETAAARLEDEARKPFGTKWERMKDSFVYNFDDMHGPIFMHIDRAQKRQLQELSASLKAGRITQADYDAVAGAFERAVKGLKIAQLTVDRGWQNEIRQYLWDMGRLFEEAKAAGVDPKNVQRYMDLRWIVSSGGRAGARGMSARDAQLVLDNMERQMGAEEFARLEGVAARFHSVREKNLLDDPRLVAMIGQDRVNYFKNNVHYVRTERLRATPEELARMEADRAQFRRDNPGDDDVTAAMLKLLAKTGGRGGGAGNSTWGHALEGSTRDIGDRFAATWRNDTRLIAAIERNDFVLQMRDALLAAKTPGVRDLPGSKGVQYPQNERYGHIRYFDGGQARVLVVPRVLADGYRQVSDSMNGWSAWGKIAHGVFIDWNLAYTLRNMTRNMASNESNIVGMRADNATIVGNALVPGTGRLASMASYQIARHLPEWVFNNPLARVVYGEHVNAAYARQAQRILELYLDPRKAVERQAQAEEARLRGDAGPAAELAADLDMLRFVTKGNALIARWDQVRGQGRDADDFMRSHGLGSVYGENAPQAPASRAQRILARAGDFLSYPFRRNARFNRELELHAKITAALAIHDRQPGLSAQEVGVEVARRASIPQSERHGAQAKFINYAWNMFYNTALKGGQRFVGNVTRNPRLLGKMAAQSLGPQLFWATMIAGGGLTAVIRNMFGGGDDAEEKAREAGLGVLLDYAQFMHDGSFAASPYLQRFYHWCPLWQVSGGRYLGIATPRTDEEKMLLPFVDWAAKYLAPQPTDPTATMADAAKRAAVGTFLPDMTARTPLVAAAQDLVFAWFQNPMDTYRGSRVYDNNLFQARFESGADATAFFGATLKQGLNDLGGRSLLASKRNEIDAAGAQPPTWGERMLHDIPGLSGVLAGTLRMTLTKEQRMDQIEKEQLRPIRAVKNLRSQDLMRMMLEDPVGNGGNETPEMKEKLDAWAAKYGWDQDKRDNVFARAFNGYQAATAEGQALAERKKQVGRRKRWAKLPESERKAMEAAGLREIEAE